MMVPDDEMNVPATETQSEAEAPITPEVEEAKPETAPDEETEDKKRLRGVERRINRLARERAEARAEADFYRAQALSRPQNGNEQPDTERPLTRAEMEQEFHRFKERETQAERARAVQGKVEKARAADPDFSDALDSSDVEFRPEQLQVFAEVVEESDHGVELLRYITKTPGEADRLSELSPLALSRELGRLEAKVIALAKPKTSNAPTPIGAVRPNASPGSPSEKDTESWISWRNKQLAAKNNR